MRSMTFLVNDRSTGSGPTPAVSVTITENANGTLAFSVNVVGPVTGDLRGFFFDVANESRIGTLSVTPTSSGFTEFRQGNDNVKDLGNGANMNGLLGSDGGYDAGVEIGKAGTGHGDDFQSFNFTLKSSAGALTLDDFANVDIGVRLTSVGGDWFCGDRDRDGEAKLLETLGRAIDAKDDAGALTEDAPVNKVTGNVFANDLYLKPIHLISAVNGSAANIGDEINGVYGTFRLNLDGSYTYKLDNSRAATQALAAGQQVVEAFTYTAKNLDELVSVSTDSASVRITITGAADNAPNAAPVITAAVAAGAVTELADQAPGEGVQVHSATGTVSFSDVNLTDSHTVSVTAAAAGYLGSLNASVTNPSTGDGTGQITWTFQVPDGAIEHLGAGESLVQSYTVSINDGHGGIATQNVSITITGANDAPVITAAADVGFVGEDSTTSASGPILFADVDLSDAHAVSFTPADNGYLGTFNATLGNDSTGDGTGAVSWTFGVSEAAINHLAEGETLTQTYHVNVDDGHGGTATQDVTITLSGANDAPTIDGVTSGATAEDAWRVARGQLTATDPDNGATVSWGITSPGNFGSASVDATGQWTYTLNDAQFPIQHLAQGQTVSDFFTVTATDEHGAFATQSVGVTIAGTNDRPVITSAPVNAATGEDSPVPITGQALAFDADDGAQLSWSVSRGSSLGYSADYLFNMDRFTIGRNGITIFDDGFGDNVAPPSAPNFLNGTPANYLTSGVYGEAGGKLILLGNGTVGFTGIGFNGLLVGENATLNTDTNSANTTAGLKINHDFVVEGIFDLTLPNEVREGYGIQLADSVNGAAGVGLVGDDQLSLLVREFTDGLMHIQLLDGNAVTDVTTLFDVPLAAGSADQIRLRLSHDDANPGLVLASYDYLTGGVVIGSGSVGSARIFGTDTPGFAGDDEGWTRAGFLALGPDQFEHATTLAGTYGTLTIDPFGHWSYAVDNTSANVLAEGETAIERFHLRVTDQFGLSSSQPLTITVNGANDAPEIVAGDTSGLVYEDGSRRDSGQLVAQDVDHNSTLTWSATGSGPNTLQADYRYLLDNLSIVRNGAQFFTDDYGNGTPPPSGTTFGYSTSGTFLESGGRLIMDGSRGVPGTFSPPGTPGVLAHTATLLTDISADPAQGLKRSQDFTVEARYDLVVPEDAFAAYSIRLNDGGSNDLIDLGVRRAADGSIVVAFRNSDVPSQPAITLQEIVLAPAPGSNQIVLRLSHTANADFVTASFDLLNNAIVTQTQAFTATAGLFDGETWTRVQINGFSPAELQNGTYGALTVQPDGQWHYTLNNNALNVQQLAQGEHATDTFTVTVTDEHGAADTQTVSIDVAGSNDAPVIVGGGTGGSLLEDATVAVGAQLIATDADHGAHLTWSVGPDVTLPLGALPAGAQVVAYNSDFHFTLDQLKIDRNGINVFNDQFNDGLAPPSAPTFGGLPSSYLTQGGYQEFGDRLHLLGTAAAAQRGIGNPDLTVGELAVLATNNDPNDLTRGLKSDDDFTVEARYDLVLPTAGQAYGITLIDNTTNGLPPDQIGDSNMSLLVRRDAGGNLVVQLNDFDVVTDQGINRETLLLAPDAGDTQIVLRLVHDNDHAGVIHAEYDLVGSTGTRTFAFTAVAHVFGAATPDYAGDDENWTRVQLVAFGPDTYAGNTSAQGLYGALTVDQNGGWNYVLDPVASQQLAQGQTFQEYFPVRVTDEYGLSAARTVTVNVTGANDPVLITNGVTSGEVGEDGVLTASGSLNFVDVDLIDTHTFFSTYSGSTAPLGSFLVSLDEQPFSADGSIAWTYVLNNDAAQFLSSGQAVTETYTVIVQDPFGSSVSQDFTITIRGADEGNQNTPPVAVDDANELDPVVENGNGSFGSFGDPTASGNVLFNDFDPDGSSFNLHVTEVNGSGFDVGNFVQGAYGQLLVGADGGWQYLLRDDLQSTNSLAQGEAAADVFTYTVQDAQGGSASATLTVAITGSNDFPTFPPGGNFGDVAENGNPIASGQLVGVDPDHGAVLRYSLANATTFSADYHFAIDQFTVSRTRPTDTAPIQVLNDTFSDNSAPPSSPPFSNGVAAGYGTRGFFTESGGEAFLDGSQAQTTFSFGAPAAALTNSATALTTNTGTDLSAGLRVSHAFEAMGRFDAITPAQVGQAYGIQFTDSVPNFGGDDNIQLLVRHDEDGLVRVVLREADATSNSITLIDSIALDPLHAGEQIALHLTHTPSQPGTVVGSFELLDGGVVVQSHTFAGHGQIFGTETPGFAGDDEAFTRAGFLAIAPATTVLRTGTYGSLALDTTTGDWAYFLNNGDPDTHALVDGMTVYDSFDAFVFDQFNIGSASAINVAVHGQGTPTAGPGATFLGTPAGETLIGTTGDDTLVGGGGNDLLAGLGGADTFDYNNLSDAVDTINDFNVSQGDKIDLHDLLLSLPGYVPGVTDPAALVFFNDFPLPGQRAGTTVLIDTDGVPNGQLNQIAFLDGVTGLHVNDLIANGNLIV